MELFIVIMAVGISALYLARRFWSSFTAKPEQGCGEGCDGCTCSAGNAGKLAGNENDCILSDQDIMNASNLEKCQEQKR